MSNYFNSIMLSVACLFNMACDDTVINGTMTNPGDIWMTANDGAIWLPPGTLDVTVHINTGKFDVKVGENLVHFANPNNAILDDSHFSAAIDSDTNGTEFDLKGYMSKVVVKQLSRCYIFRDWTETVSIEGYVPDLSTVKSANLIVPSFPRRPNEPNSCQPQIDQITTRQYGILLLVPGTEKRQAIIKATIVDPPLRLQNRGQGTY